MLMISFYDSTNKECLIRLVELNFVPEKDDVVLISSKKYKVVNRIYVLEKKHRVVVNVKPL